MIDGILQTIAIGDLTSSVLLGLVVLLILSGRLVTRNQLEDVRTERNEWRVAYEKEREARHDLQQQLQVVLPYVRLTAEFIRKLPHPDDDDRGQP